MPPFKKAEEYDNNMSDIEALISGSGISEAAIKDYLENKMSEEAIQHKKKPFKNNKITDINDEKVILFDTHVDGRKVRSNSVFSVYNKKSGTEMLVRGSAVPCYFGMYDEEKLAYERKQYGARIEVNNYRILFKYAIHEYKE